MRKNRLFLFGAIALVLVLAISCAIAAGDWYCPHCGRLNHDNFCPVDGTKKPEDLDVPADQGNQEYQENQENPENPENPVDPDYEYTERVMNDPLTTLFELTNEFPGVSVRMRGQADPDFRYASYTGPGKKYQGAGGYKPAKIQEITAYYAIDNWVLCDVKYATAEERFVYLSRSALNSMEDIPVLTEDLPYYKGTIIGDGIPCWGPGSDFNYVPFFKAKAGTKIKVYFQANGFVYGEYKTGGQKVRMWFPSTKVEVENMFYTQVDEDDLPTDYSSFGLNPGEVIDPEGDWEDWGDDYNEDDGWDDGDGDSPNPDENTFG